MDIRHIHGKENKKNDNTIKLKDLRDLKEEAVELLNKGLSKQEAFDILKKKYYSQKSIVSVLRYIPTKARKRKYGIFVWTAGFLLILISLFISIYLYSSPVLLTVFIVFQTVAVYNILRFNVKYYHPVNAYLIILFSTFATISALNDSTKYVPLVVVLSFATFIAGGLILWLSLKLAPEPEKTKELFIDSNGKKRFRLVYIFKD
jgi:hypothetical protein